MDAFFGVCGFFGIIISLVVICIKAIKKQPKKNASVALLICFCSFVLGLALSGNKDKSGENGIQTAVASYNAETVDRSIPDESIEEETTEEIREVTTEEIAVITTEEQISEDLAVVATEATAEELTTEVTTEVTTEATTEATTEEITTEEPTTEEVTTEAEKEYDYVLNKNTKKFHYPSCYSVDKMKEKNKLEFHGTREEVINKGYEPCKNCNP